MNFDLSEEQKMLRDAAQKFLRTEYRFDARNQIVASASGMSREHWQRFGEFGWLGLGLPGAHGGYGYQHREEVPNLRYINGTISLSNMLSYTSILIMPSEKEGLPTLAMEAMALGVPVVGSAIPAFVELGLRKNLIKTKNYFLHDI